MPIFYVRVAWLRGCEVARLLGSVTAGLCGCWVAWLRGCVAAGLLENMSAVFSYVEYIHLYSKYEKTAAQLVNAWLLGCAAAGPRGCGVAGLRGCGVVLLLQNTETLQQPRGCGQWAGPGSRWICTTVTL